MNQVLKYHRLHTDVPEISFASEQSACFDLRAHFPPNATRIEGYDVNSMRIATPVIKDSEGRFTTVVHPGERMMIPTGIVFDIPVGYSVRIHARSGLALKAGLIMANSEGVIDSDYTEETKIIVLNISSIPIKINHGDRIAQAEMVPVLQYNLVPTTEIISQKTSRAGGFGSTGIS
jgi:dUTP pyrophosphatase